MIRLICCSLLSLFIFLLVSCEKEIGSDTIKQNDMLFRQNLEKAKQWFESNFSNQANENIVLDWENAISIGEDIEIPFTTNGLIGNPDLVKQLNLPENATQRILIITSEGKYKMTGVHYVPNETFIDNMNVINVKNAGTYKFNGFIFLTTYGSKERKYRRVAFSNGEITNIFKGRLYNNSQPRNKNGDCQDCSIVTVTKENPDFDPTDPEETDPQWIWGNELVCTTIPCTTDTACCPTEPGGGNSGGDGGDNGGGWTEDCTDPCEFDSDCGWWDSSDCPE